MAEFYIGKKDWATVLNYAKASVKLNDNAEVGGMMVMQKDRDGDYVLKAPEILKQEVSGTRCVMDAEALALFYSKAHRKYKKNGTVRYVWWHSHANMKAFWSGTDDKTILSNESDDFTVSLVVNVKAEYQLRVQYFQPILLDDNVDLNILDAKRAEIPKSIMAEVKEKCTKPAVTTYTSHYMDRNKLGKVKDMQQTSFDYGYGGHNPAYAGVSTDYSPDGQRKGHVDYTTLCTYIDGLNEQYVKGSIKYDSWKRAVEGTNEQLEQRDSDWRFHVLDAKTLDEVIYYATASEFINSIHITGEELSWV